MGEAAQFLLFGGPILTLDPAQPRVEALAVGHGRILAAGSRAQVSPWSGPLTEAIDLKGRAMLPGLIDAHLHLEQYARAMDQLDCQTPTKAECLTRVRARATQTPIGEWILGHGWNQNQWNGFGTAGDLDAAAPHHPVYLSAKSLHAAWVNSRALALAAIDAATPDPPGGRIGRDERGLPNGLLFEAAVRLVSSILPPPSPERLGQQLLRAQEALLRLGLTGIHDFDGPRCFQALQLLQQRGQLRLRVVKQIPVDALPACLDIGLRTGFGNSWLRIGNVKVFADGALGPRTAAMLKPYLEEPENRGMLLIEKDALLDVGRRAAKGGLALAVHAIGDRANRLVLDVLDALRAWQADHGLEPLPHRIEHLQLLHPNDIPRVASLGIIASMQPIHATSDQPMADRYWGDRVHSAYAWRSLSEAGAVLAFGSDAPVESPNPFWGLHAAVTRRSRNGDPGPEGWIPEQRLDLKRALLGYTRGPAEAARTADVQGRLTPGAWADLIVLPQDPFDLDPNVLHELLPQATMVGGEWSFRSF
ncbi:MAG: amidohydrolase family protein [Chloroflexota bacterium]